jgi:hypothetical protein
MRCICPENHHEQLRRWKVVFISESFNSCCWRDLTDVSIQAEDGSHFEQNPFFFINFRLGLCFINKYFKVFPFLYVLNVISSLLEPNLQYEFNSNLSHFLPQAMSYTKPFWPATNRALMETGPWHQKRVLHGLVVLWFSSFLTANRSLHT